MEHLHRLDFLCHLWMKERKWNRIAHKHITGIKPHVTPFPLLRKLPFWKNPKFRTWEVNRLRICLYQLFENTKTLRLLTYFECFCPSNSRIIMAAIRLTFAPSLLPHVHAIYSHLRIAYLMYSPLNHLHQQKHSNSVSSHISASLPSHSFHKILFSHFFFWLG